MTRPLRSRPEPRPSRTGSGARMRAAVRLLLVLLAAAPVATAVGGTVDTGPPPAWVEPLEPDVSPWAGSDGRSLEFLHYDTQMRVEPRDADRWIHLALRLKDPAAVEENSQIDLEFDPTYQVLTLHRLRVHREGRVRDLLASGEYDVLERATHAGPLLYDGRTVRVIVPRDLRPGDVLEYAYTHAGRNPVYDTHFGTSISLGFSFPVRRLRHRLLWERPDEPRFLEVGPEGPRSTEPARVGEAWVWDATDLAALDADGWTPAWFLDFPGVEITDCRDWEEVRAWGRELFAVGGMDASSVRAVADSIGALADDPAVRAERALRFVQEDLRYVGIEIGVNSHRPRAPDLVIANRYGDCKDKSLLLVALLRRLGIEAAPALVNTWSERGIVDRLPTVNRFDHVIVRLVLDERVVWVDPTRSYERGGLLDRPDFAYGAALVLDGSTGGLEVVPTGAPAEPFTHVRVDFHLGGYEEPVPMTVETIYRGWRADDVRSWVSGFPREQHTEENREYYAALYPGIEAAAEVEVEDDEETGVLVVRERYRVPGFWTRDGEDEPWLASFEPLEFHSVFPDLLPEERTTPLAVNHPTSMRYEIHAHTRRPWHIEEESHTWTTPASEVSFSAELADTTLHLQWDYRSRADHVASGEARDHLLTLAGAEEFLSYAVVDGGLGPVVSVRWDPGVSAGKARQTAGFALVILGLVTAGLAFLLYRSAPRWPHAPSVAPPDGDRRSGPGGGLLPFTVLALLLPVVGGVCLVQAWQAIGRPVPDLGDPEVTVIWRPWLAGVFVFAAVGTIWAGATLLAFVRGRRSFPLFWAGSALFAAALALVAPFSFRYHAVSQPLATGGLGLGLALLLAGAGFAYLVRAQRVRHTFRHPVPAPPPVPARPAPPRAADPAPGSGPRPGG